MNLIERSLCFCSTLKNIFQEAPTKQIIKIHHGFLIRDHKLKEMAEILTWSPDYILCAITCQNSGSASEKVSIVIANFGKGLGIQRLELWNRSIFKLTRLSHLNPVGWVHIVGMRLLHYYMCLFKLHILK